jgi:anti-sigma factor RsiW
MGRQLALWAADLVRGSLLPPGTSGRAEQMKSLEARLSRQREEVAAMVFPEMTAAESDLWAGEALDAFDDLASEFLETLNRADHSPSGESR